jgi:hypothetical protein
MYIITTNVNLIVYLIVPLLYANKKENVQESLVSTVPVLFKSPITKSPPNLKANF